MGQNKGHKVGQNIVWHASPAAINSSRLMSDPSGLTFSWWGCYDLCLGHKRTELVSLFFFYSVLVSVSFFMALSTVLHSMNSLDNSPLSDSVLLILFLPYWSFQLYYESLPQPFVVDWA